MCIAHAADLIHLPGNTNGLALGRSRWLYRHALVRVLATIDAGVRFRDPLGAVASDGWGILRQISLPSCPLGTESGASQSLREGQELLTAVAMPFHLLRA